MKYIELGQIPKNPIRIRDIDKLKKQHAEMYQALKWLINGINEESLTISTTATVSDYYDEIITGKLLEIKSILKEIEYSSKKVGFR